MQRSSALRTILTAGLIAGILDGLDAVVFIAWIRGIPVERVFQFIASGALGASGVSSAVISCIAISYLASAGELAGTYGLRLCRCLDITLTRRTTPYRASKSTKTTISIPTFGLCQR